jgi:hypothetical protein
MFVAGAMGDLDDAEPVAGMPAEDWESTNMCNSHPWVCGRRLPLLKGEWRGAWPDKLFLVVIMNLSFYSVLCL